MLHNQCELIYNEKRKYGYQAQSYTNMSRYGIHIYIGMNAVSDRKMNSEKSLDFLN